MCGRVAGVINMESSKKQTLIVEVMPLIGGHLQLPRVRLSKYIPAASTGNALLVSNDIASTQTLGTRGMKINLVSTLNVTLKNIMSNTKNMRKINFC